MLNGDATPLARIAPTSLVFGVWDSRDTQAKLPRVIASTVRAFNVRTLTRGAVYIPPVDYAELDVFTEEEKARAEGDNKNPLAKRGFVHVPASASHGGVIADGGIRRDATLGLAALRLLHAGKDEAGTLALRRYILGLALVSFTYNASGYLRQGCLLVGNPDKANDNELVEAYARGERKPCGVTHGAALSTPARRRRRSVSVGTGLSPSTKTRRRSTWPTAATRKRSRRKPGRPSEGDGGHRWGVASASRSVSSNRSAMGEGKWANQSGRLHHFGCSRLLSNRQLPGGTSDAGWTSRSRR